LHLVEHPAKVPKLVVRLEKAHNLLLADSLRLAFLVPDERVEASSRRSRAPAHLLDALSGAVRLADIPAKYRQTLTRIPLAVPPDKQLFEYQGLGVAYLLRSKLRCYLADSQGLGKTIEAIVALATAARAGKTVCPAAVVCPASVLHNWAKEIRAWSDLHPVVLESNQLPPPVNPNTVYILTWARLAPTKKGRGGLVRPLYHAGLRTLILDEAQAIKSPRAARSRAARALAHRVPYLLLLSGTPLENRIGELWHPLHLLDPETYPSPVRFAAQVQEAARREVKVLDTRGRIVKRTFEGGDPNRMLDGQLCHIMVRRTKTQALGQLPSKTREFLIVDLPRPTRLAYKRTEQRIRDYLATRQRQRRLDWAARYYHMLVDRERLAPEAALLQAVATVARKIFPFQASALAALGTLRQLVGQAKVPLAVQWILDGGRDPLVVFCEHRAVALALQSRLAKVRAVAVVLGGTNARKRRAVVQRFQAGDLDILIASRALSTGVTLTRASRGLFVERWWLPTVEEQGEDRLHRVGQVQAVQWTYLLASETVDEHVARVVDGKRALVERVLGGEKVEVQTEAGTVEGRAAEQLSQDLAQAVAARLASGASADRSHLTETDLARYLAQHQAKRLKSSRKPQ